MKTLALLIILVSGLAFAGLSQALKYDVCESANASSTLNSVKINDCESLEDACAFVRGLKKTIELEFVPKRAAKEVKVKILGKLKKVPVPFHVNPDSACGNYGITCPLEAGKPYTFTLSLPILRTYPKVGVNVVLHLLDENGGSLVCLEMPVRIQEPQAE